MVVNKNNPTLEFELASQGHPLRSYGGIAGEIQRLIKQATQELGLPEVDFGVEHPAEETHGDYSSNVALRLGKRELAQKIAGEINKKLPEWVSKIEVAGPGFINFYLSEHYLWEEVKRVLQEGSHYAKATRDAKRKIMVEFTDPNPFKEFHIGHLYSNAVGEALCRLWEFNGATVRRVNYQGDVGMHVAKALWALLRIQKSKGKIQNLQKKPLVERVKMLGEAYAAGAKAYESDELAKAEIEKINQQVYEHDPEMEELYQKGRAWSLEYFETIYARLGTKFDFYYFESSAGEVGVKLVREWLKKGVFEESKGAVIFPGEKYGLHTRVFINALGLPTYEAKELGLAPTKYKDFAYDKSVIVTANEINEYFKVLIAAMKQVEPELGQKTEHVGHGIVRLPEGKMSSRTGSIITGEWLLDEVKKRVAKVAKVEAVKQVAEIVAIGAVKYALLKSSIGQDIVFDVDKSVSLAGNSGPYLQYTYARARSVLRKARSTKSEARNKSKNLNVLNFKNSDLDIVSNFDIRISNLNAEERAILRWLYRFPEVVVSAGAAYEPSQICTYLYELAQRFNTFYNRHTILGNEFRLAMTAAVGQIIKNGLWVLGIKSPEKM